AVKVVSALSGKGTWGSSSSMISLEGEEATHKSELTVNRSRKNLSETFHPFPASLSHSPGNLPGGSIQ
ncbi:Uncharacterized protein APZ42_000951, partial [Daphnia magna]